MKQLLMVAALTGLLTTMSGCASMQGGCLGGSCDAQCDSSCGGSCSSCKDCGGRQGLCGNGCHSGQCGGGARGCFDACSEGCATGCRPSPLRWQQGGSDYAHKLTYGMLKHGQVPQTRGPQVASTAYPYYTNRGPRDFLAANPPSIGR